MTVRRLDFDVKYNDHLFIYYFLSQRVGAFEFTSNLSIYMILLSQMATNKNTRLGRSRLGIMLMLSKVDGKNRICKIDLCGKFKLGLVCGLPCPNATPNHSEVLGLTTDMLTG